ncbi:MAG: TolC family protein [Planctomycetes bacterium]|nr:TolC family protein [Planctomycetota bacterium]
MVKRFRGKGIWAGLAALALAGCIRYRPEPISVVQRLDTFEARTLDSPELRSFLQKNLNLATWPPRSWDLRLLSWVAFYYHPDLDVARAESAVARAGIITAGERPNPTIGLTPTIDTTAIGTPDPYWIPGMSVDFPVETAGKRGYRIARAKNLSQAARLNIATVAWQVYSRLRRSLLDLYAAKKTQDLLKAQQAIQADMVKLLERQRAAGAVSPFNVTRARIALNTSRLAVNDAERKEAEARAQVANALGLSMAALQGVNISFDAFKRLPSNVPSAEVRRRALLARTDILGALAEYAASQAALQLEISRQYPDINIGPGYELDQTDNKWTLGISITLPVFNQNQGAIAEAEANRTEAAARFNALQARVIGEIDRALVSYRLSIQKLATTDALLAELKSQEQTAKAMFKAGELTKLEVTGIELELSTGLIENLDARMKVQEALGLLEDAMQGPLNASSAPGCVVPKDFGAMKEKTHE